MAKFKVGDVVKYNDRVTDGVGVVRAVEMNRYFVDCFTMLSRGGYIGSIRFGDKFKEIIPDYTGWLFMEDDLKAVEYVTEYNGFHVGDRVETRKEDFSHGIGFTGTVVGIDTESRFPIWVRYDEKYTINGGIDLCGILHKGSTQGAIETCESLKIINHIIDRKDEPCITPSKAEQCKYTDTKMRCIEKIKKILNY